MNNIRSSSKLFTQINNTEILDNSTTSQLLDIFKRSIFLQETTRENSQTTRTLSPTNQKDIFNKLNSGNIKTSLKVKLNAYYREFLGIIGGSNKSTVRHATVTNDKEEKNKNERLSHMKGQIIDMLCTKETIANKLNRKFDHKEEKSLSQCSMRLSKMKKSVDRVLRKERQFYAMKSNPKISVIRNRFTHHRELSTSFVTSPTLKREAHGKEDFNENLNFNCNLSKTLRRYNSSNSMRKEDRNTSSILLKLDLASISNLIRIDEK